MTHYLILAEGGCYGNFLACLIRSMWDINFTKGKKFTKSGSCDLISDAYSISVLIRDEYKNFNLYPETIQMTDLIVQILQSKEYTKKMTKYELDYDHINTFHYLKKSSVDKFLTVDNVKIIYIVMEPDDSYIVALNKISKNFSAEFPFDSIKDSFKKSIKSNIDEYNRLTDFDTMSGSLKKELVLSFADKMKKRSFLSKPDSDERILFLKFKDIISNKNKVLEDLAVFTNSKINDSSIDFYHRYLEAQKTALNYLESDIG